MGNKIEVKVLDALLDLYENSKTFTGDNVNEQRFKIQTSKLFPKYDDDSEYAFYKEVNTDLEFLKAKGFISYKSEKTERLKMSCSIQTMILLVLSTPTSIAHHGKKHKPTYCTCLIPTPILLMSILLCSILSQNKR
ncbi:MAG: hypothetical protein IJU92_04680 [Spirochaetaceae bacterium]|nr:hypothetical protein [Spirochaetaceae bacterium]